MTDTAPVLDLFSPEFIRDPEPMIERMLAEQPIAFDARINAWLIGRYADIKALEREPRLSSQRQEYVNALLPVELHAHIRPMVDWYARWMVMLDGADHRRIRSLAAYAFQPRSLNKLAGRIDEILDMLLDRIVAAAADGAREMEVKRDLGYPLPRLLICEMVGIPPADVERFATWVHDLNLFLAAGLTTKAAIERALASQREITEYFTQLIAERRQRPRKDEILTSLVQATEADDSLTDTEIIDLVAFIMTGAYETTTQLITNGLYLLLQHPEQLATVRADRSLVTGLVEETLRLAPSVALNTRAVAEPFAYQGHRFEAGQSLYFIAIAGNRDPEHFADPSRFDITRANSKDHLTFGFGPHFCIGAPLARLEARRAFTKLLERLPDMRLAEQEIHWKPNMIVRELEQLRVLF